MVFNSQKKKNEALQQAEIMWQCDKNDVYFM